MPWVAAIAAVGQIASSAASAQQAGASRDAAQRAANDAISRLDAIGLPPDLSAPIITKQFQQAGILTPELEQHINAGTSAMANVKGSPEAKKAQLDALSALKERGQAGFTLQERAELNKALQESETGEHAREQALMQQMQARGMGGSGAELAAALQGSQSATNRASENALNIAAQGQQRALQSIAQAGQLGGQIEQQQFGEEAAKAQAQDIFNRLNYENQVATQQRNIAAKNAAQQYNLANAQQMSNLNTAQNNQELLRQKQAQQNYWDSRLRQAGGAAAAKQNESNFYSNIANQQAKSGAAQAAGIGSLINTVGNAFAKSGGSDKVTTQQEEEE